MFHCCKAKVPMICSVTDVVTLRVDVRCTLCGISSDCGTSTELELILLNMFALCISGTSIRKAS